MSAPVERHPTPATGRDDRAPEAHGNGSGADVSELERHAAVVRLHLAAGDADLAARALESIVSDGVLVWELVDLFEEVAARPGQHATLERLALHYECVGSFDGSARIRTVAVELASNPRERHRRVRELVRLQMARAAGGPRRLTASLAELVTDLANFDDGLVIVYRATLVRALLARRSALTDAAFDDAAEAAWQALEGLSKLYLRRGSVERAARLLERGALLCFDRARQRSLLHRAAFLYADRVGDDDAAIRLFRQIFEDDGADEVARVSFDRFRALLAAGRHHAKLAWLLEQRGRQAARSGDPASARAYLERAGQLWEAAADPARACAAHTRASKLGSERSLEALARIHAALGNWKDAVAALEQLRERSPDGRRTYALRLATALVALDDAERARAVIDDVLGAKPAPHEASAARALLLELHRRARAFRPLAGMLEEDARENGGVRTAVLLCEAAEIYGRDLGDAREAVRCLELARQADPANVSVHPALAETLAGLEMWDELIDVLAEHVSLHGHRRGAALVELRLRLVDALVEIGRVDAALEQLHLATELAPSDPAVLHGRGRLELALYDLDAAGRTLRAAFLAARGGRRARIYADLSAVAMQRGDPDRALAFISSALELAIECGEDLRPIEVMLRKLEQHSLLARSLETRCRRASDAMERIAALEALVALWRGPLGSDAGLAERLRGNDSLVRHVAGALDADASDRACETAWSRLCWIATLLDDDGLLHDIAELRLAPLAALNRGPERAALRVAVAKMLLDRCGPSETAIAQLFGAVSDDPSHSEAATVLAETLERTERFDEAASVLAMRWRSLDPDDAEYIDVAWGLGRLLECASRPEEAGTVYASILDALAHREPDATALRALAGRLSELGNERLADCLERLLTLEYQPEDGLVRRLIALRTDQGDQDGLARALVLGLRGGEAQLEYVDPLVRIFETRGDAAAASRVLLRAVLAAPEDRALLWRLVEANQRAGSDADSLAPIDVALRRSPEDVELRILSARVHERVADVDGALRDLRMLGACDARTASLAVPIVRRVLDRAEDQAANDHAVAAAVVLSRIGLPAEAESALELVLARAPDAIGPLQRLAPAAALRGDWEQAANLYARLVVVFDLAEHDPASFGLVVAFGEACQRAGRPSDAREALERAFVMQPDNDAVASQLECNCEAMGAWRRLSELLVARARKTTDRARKEKLVLRAARVLVEEACAPEEALGLLESASAEYLDSVAVSLESARALIALARPRDGLTLLERTLARAHGESAALRAEVLLEMGKAHLALEEPAEAFGRLRAGLELHTRNRELAMLLGLAAHDLGDEATAERALKLAIELASGEDGRRAEEAAIDARVASRIIAAIAQTRGRSRTYPPRRASGIEPRAVSPSARPRAWRNAR